MIVADGSYAVVEFLANLVRLPHVTLVTRMRLDAALYDPAPAREAGKKGRPAVKGKRQPTLAKRLTDPATAWQTSTVSWYGGSTRSVEMATGTALWYHAGVAPVQILAWFVMRWPVEVTFHEVRTHLGVETQRQWSDLAILRTTSALLGLFSLVTIFAHQLLGEQSFPVRQAAWYVKALPTFSDTLVFVRQHLWPSCFFARSSFEHEVMEIPRVLFDRLVDTLAFTA